MHVGDHLYIALLAFVCSGFLFLAIRISSIFQGRVTSLTPRHGSVGSWLLKTLPFLIVAISAAMVVTLLKTSVEIIPHSGSIELKLSLAGCFVFLVAWISLLGDTFAGHSKRPAFKRENGGPRHPVATSLAPATKKPRQEIPRLRGETGRPLTLIEQTKVDRKIAKSPPKKLSELRAKNPIDAPDSPNREKVETNKYDR